MKEIAKVILENEMDLILAHKQSMKIAELLGLSLSAQTTFATAVSEICRFAISRNNHACLTLVLATQRMKDRYLRAVLEADFVKDQLLIREGVQYARRLVPGVRFTENKEQITVELEVPLSSALHVNDALVEDWKIILNNDPAISPYEEIKRKNRQLTELSERVRTSEQQYRLLADSLPIMIYTFTNEGKLMYANQWLLRYTGLTVAQLNEAKYSNIYHPDDFGNIWSNWEKDHNNNLVNKERKLKSGSGEYRWHSGVSIPIKDEDGNILYWNAFMVDIHAQKIIEETLKDNIELKETKAELEEKVDQLNKSNKMLEQFAFVASHDLQEPLRKIGFFSNYIKTNYGAQLGPEGGKFLDKLVTETERTREIVRDILYYSTINTDNGFSDNLDLNEIVHTVLSDMEILLMEKDAHVNVALLPSVFGNRVQMTQLFSNLISNAIKFVPAGTRPEVQIGFEADDTSRSVIRVSDNGIGIEEQFHHKIFELFQRLHPKDEYSGTGIGLSTCKKIMEFHGGHMFLESRLGEGSTFILSFPKSGNNPA
ncbi:sensor histidine kinase [Rurimicrobium arvi]|uniref:histidine kinase n=1 Tax=Rurimicrobium arvi TaxID=2049916 RepID=A0ABP8MXG6_9BACT